MSKDSARAAIAQLTEEEADLLNNSPDLLNKFKQKHGISDSGVSDQKKISGYGLPPVIQKAAELIQTPIRGFRGIGVGAEKTLAGVNPLKFMIPGGIPNQNDIAQMAGNFPTAVERAAAAVKPGYVPQQGEKLGAALGEAGATAGLLAPLSAITPARLGAQMAMGAGTGGALTALSNAAEQGRFNPMETAGNAAVGAILPFLGSKTFAKGAGKVAGALGRIQSGVEQKAGERLFEDPGALFTPSLEKAGEKLGGFRSSVGLNPIKHTTAEIIDAEAGVARKIVKNVDALLEKNPEQLKPIDLLKAKQSVDDIIEVTPMKQRQKRAELFELKNKFTNALEEKIPGDKAAAKEYSRSVLGSKFKKFFPVTKQGDISLTRTVGLPAMEGLPAGIGSLVAGAVQSPSLAGLGISAAGAATKAGQAVLKTPGVIPAIQSVVKTLTDDEAKRYYRKALKITKGDKAAAAQLARQMAVDDKKEIPR